MGFPGVVGGGLFPALIRLEDKDRAVKEKNIREKKKIQEIEKLMRVRGGVFVSAREKWKTDSERKVRMGERGHR